MDASGGQVESANKDFKWNAKKQRIIIQGGENISASENGLLVTLDVEVPLLKPGLSSNSLPQVCCINASLQVRQNSLKNVIVPSCTPGGSNEDEQPPLPPFNSESFPPSFLR